MCAEVNISRRTGPTLILFSSGENWVTQPTTSFKSKKHQFGVIVIELALNDQNSYNINVINLSLSKNKNSNKRTNCKENCSKVFESKFMYTANKRFKCCTLKL